VREDRLEGLENLVTTAMWIAVAVLVGLCLLLILRWMAREPFTFTWRRRKKSEESEEKKKRRRRIRLWFWNRR
jgi:hypothetical protein